MNNFNKIIKGAIGNVKYSLGVDPSDTNLINKRLNICNNCENIKKKKTITNKTIATCGVCDCPLNKKVSIKSEECPIKRW